MIISDGRGQFLYSIAYTVGKGPIETACLHAKNVVDARVRARRSMPKNVRIVSVGLTVGGHETTGDVCVIR